MTLKSWSALTHGESSTTVKRLFKRLKPAGGDLLACFAGGKRKVNISALSTLTRQPQGFKLTKSQQESQGWQSMVYNGISERLRKSAPDLRADDKATFSAAWCRFRGSGIRITLILVIVGYLLQTAWLIPASVALSHFPYLESSPCSSHPSLR